VQTSFLDIRVRTLRRQSKFLFSEGLFVKLESMSLASFSLTGLLIFSLVACTAREDKKAPVATPARRPVVVKKDSTPKDEVAALLTRVFAQADGVHREAWWVLSEDRRPISKSPFGKVERAYMTVQNLKLPNKSLFRCDRYVMKRDVKGLLGYPQTAEIFEKCSEKVEAKKIAYVTAKSKTETEVTFYPDHLEEILGMGASFLNRIIECSLKNNDEGTLTELRCKNWAQDRTKEQMIRLDTYEYLKSSNSLIKLRGKVFVNLTETRKIVADVPMDGKILVTETEMFAPEPEKPTPTPTPVAAVPPPRGRGAPGQQPGQPIQPPMQGGPMADPGVVMEPAAPTAIDPLLVRQKEMYDRGETDDLPVVEGMLAAPPVAPAAPVGGPAAEGQLGAEPNGEVDPGQQPGVDQAQPAVNQGQPRQQQAPREEVIHTNENEGEYHAR
jgi:hypothetical protein